MSTWMRSPVSEEFRGGRLVLNIAGESSFERFRAGASPLAISEDGAPSGRSLTITADGYVALPALEMSADGYVVILPVEITADAIVTAPDTRIFPRPLRSFPAIPAGRIPTIP